MNQRASLILETERLSLKRGQRKVLNIKKLQFHKGIIYGIVGPAGCGKSSFLRLISGMEKPSSGTVLYDGKSFKSNWLGKPIQDPDIYHIGTEQVNGSGTGEVIVRTAFPEKADDIRKRHFDKSRFGHIWKSKVRSLTVGERSVLASVLAIESDPRILVLDDYGVYMPHDQEAELRKKIRNMNQNLGTTILLASQSDHYLRQFASVMIYLDKGHVSRIRSGAKQQQRGRPNKRRQRKR